MCAVVSAVVLAAGAASRFGSPKQQLLLEPVLARVPGATAIDDIEVVLGADDVETDARTVRCGGRRRRGQPLSAARRIGQRRHLG